MEACHLVCVLGFILCSILRGLPYFITHLPLRNSVPVPHTDALSEATPQLLELWLNGNQIGDGGMQAFASAVAGGALPMLNNLIVNDGELETEHPALKAACQARGISLG